MYISSFYVCFQHIQPFDEYGHLQLKRRVFISQSILVLIERVGQRVPMLTDIIDWMWSKLEIELV